MFFERDLIQPFLLQIEPEECMELPKNALVENKPSSKAPKSGGGGRRGDVSGSKKRGFFELDGLRVNTVGNYSICPKCNKNIKSTFIIRYTFS